jgi:hypothetical protein
MTSRKKQIKLKAHHSRIARARSALCKSNGVGFKSHHSRVARARSALCKSNGVGFNKVIYVMEKIDLHNYKLEKDKAYTDKELRELMEKIRLYDELKIKLKIKELLKCSTDQATRYFRVGQKLLDMGVIVENG